jgi:type II secretory pathway pseudopilin PulG
MVVVIGVVIMLATGIVAGTTATLARTRTNELRSTALQYAQEGIEQTRSKRDAGWQTFAALGSTQDVPPLSNKSVYCLGDDGIFLPTVVSCTTPNVHGKYTRSVTLTLVSPADPSQMYMSVDVVVSWGNTANPTNSVELKTDLTQWR